jgi:hypothetical protein
MGRIRRSLPVGVAVAVLALAGAAGCGTSSPGPNGSSSLPGPAASGQSPTTPAATAPARAAGCDTAAWRTAPVSVQHGVSVPPVPVVAGVRVAEHPECGYDRLVFDLNGAVPSYDVRYVSRVIGDASGKTIALPGQQYLLITLKPAQGHTAAGAPTLSRQIQRPGYPALQSWVMAGDVEGVLRIAVGLPHQVSIRTGELAGRIYVDVREQ